MQFFSTTSEREVARVVALLPTTAFALDAPSEDDDALEGLSLYKLSLIKAKAKIANGMLRSNIFLVDVILIFVGVFLMGGLMPSHSLPRKYWKRER